MRALLLAVMQLSALVAVSASLPEMPNVTNFTNDYYLEHRRDAFEQLVMTRWPGPDALLELWAEDLNQRQRVAVLLGGAAYHDPILLPIYAEAATSDDPLLRKAAAFAYRDLIADRLPNVRGGVTLEQGRALAGEIRAVSDTLRTRSLPELWLDAALYPEQQSFTGRPGVVLRRSPEGCLKALDRLYRPEDIDLYVRALELSTSDKLRIGLVQFIEAAALQEFLIIPRGPREPRPYGLYLYSIEAAEQWLVPSCEIDTAEVIGESMSELGARGVDPYASWSIDVWLHLLRKGPARWWPTASIQLYRFGGPYVPLSVLRADGEANDASRRKLLGWYGQKLGDEPQSLPKVEPGRILPGPRRMPHGRGEP